MRLTWRGLSAWQKGLFALALLYSLFHLTYSVARYNPISTPRISSDFQMSYREAAHWSQTRQLKLMGSTNMPYPIFFYWWLSPLTVVPYPALSFGLYLAQFPLFAWALLLLVRIAAPDSTARPMECLVAFMLAANFQPFLETLSQHKAEGLEFFLLCVALFAFKRGKDLQTGAVLFFAAALKYLPGFLAIYFLLKREWRVAAGFLLAAVGCTAAFILLHGAEAFWNLGIRQTLWLGFSPQAESNHLIAVFELQSLTQVVNRSFTRVDPGPFREMLQHAQQAWVTYPQAAWWTGMVLKLLFFCAFLFWIRKRTTRPRRSEAWPVVLLEISVALTMIPILFKMFRIHYGILLLPAFVTTGLILLQYGHRLKKTEKILFAAGYGLSAMLIPGGLLNQLPPHSLWGRAWARLYFWWSLPFYGYLLLGLAALLCRRRLKGAFPRA